MVKNLQFNDCLKHIELQHHFVSVKFDKEEIKILCIPLKELMIDLLTEALLAESFAKHVMQMGLK